MPSTSSANGAMVDRDRSPRAGFSRPGRSAVRNTSPTPLSTRSPLHVCYVSAYYDPSMVTGAQLIDRIYTIREFAENVAKLGHTVDVVQLFHRDETLRRNGVTYRFVRPGSVSHRFARLATAIRNGRSEPEYTLGDRMLSVIRGLQPDVIHFFGLTLDLNLWLVARALREMDIPLVVQYHGGRPARNPVRQSIQQWNLKHADRFLFTTGEHAQPWIDAGLPLDPARVVEFMETSSVFRPKPRKAARAATGMTGDPVFLWAGRLHREKDPIVALRAFARIHQCWRNARLYLYYLTDELLPVLNDFMDGHPDLADAVHFCGRAPYPAMEDIYNSADFFIQASHREASGCAVLEAMSCGVIPVVTDIPSFRAMTDNGRVGVLFPPGDVDTLTRSVLSIKRNEFPRRSRAVLNRFEKTLSFQVLARQLDSVYREVVDASSTQPVSSG